MGDSAFVKSTHRFDGKTVRAVVLAGQTANIDHKVLGATGRSLNGGILFTVGAVFGDEITFQIVDVDNILGYGAGTVLDEFLTWSVDPSEQLVLILPYRSHVPMGLYIRGVYKSVGVTDVSVGINLKLHRGL